MREKESEWERESKREGRESESRKSEGRSGRETETRERGERRVLGEKGERET